MNKLILTVDGEEHSKLLSRLLRSVSFIKNIEQEKEEEELEKEVEAIISKRWNDYKKNPKSFVSDKELRTRLNKKYAV